MHLGACLAQCLEKQGKSFFPGPFSDARFVGDEPSCSSGVRSTQGGHPLYKGGGKKTGSSHLLPSPLETSKPANSPQNVPCFTPRGYWCPQAEEQRTGSFWELPLQGRRHLAMIEGERADRKARDSYTLKMRKYGWKSIRTRCGEPRYRTGACCTHKGSKAQPQGDCHEQYDTLVLFGGDSPALVHPPQRLSVVWTASQRGVGHGH